MKRCILIALFFAASLPRLSAQDVKVTATIDSNKYLIGQWIVTHLTVDAPKDFRIALPTKPEQFEKATFVSAEKERITEQGGSKRYEQTLTITCFDTGAISIAAIVRYYKPGDTTSYTATSNPLSVVISNVVVDTTGTFRDIKDVLHVNLSIWDYLLYFGIALALAAACWYGYKRWKRRPAPAAEEAPPPPPVPIHVIAKQRLLALETEKLWQAGRAKEYQSALTDILRDYVEKRYGFPALEETTGEIIAGIALQGVEPALVTETERVLRVADQTKFAKYQPTPQEHLAAMAVALDFVDKTFVEEIFTPLPAATVASEERAE